ncbi:MAG: hypothetical protein R3F61_32985 [Myxococcota bacterium]
MRMLSLVLALPSVAFASIDPRCAGTEVPADYEEQAQQDFLANHVALATSFSAVHGPIPHAPGHGAIGFDLGLLPPLGCERRLVLDGTKTEDTNQAPAVPRIRVSYAFPAVGRVVPYAGFGYLPPVELLGTTNVIVSGELGAGVQIAEHFQAGVRTHFTLQKTVGEIATPFVAGDPAVDDLYLGSTFGFDVSVGVPVGSVTPYVAGGLTDVSTVFWIGDDGVMVDNLHPYLGPTFSGGVDALALRRVRLGAELYVAPGGYSLPDPSVESALPAGRYGHLTTARLRVAIEL